MRYKVGFVGRLFTHPCRYDIYNKLKDIDCYYIHDGDKIYHRVDMSEKELAEFIENLNNEQFEGISEFFDTMPKVQHVIKVTNPKTKKKGEIVIEGIDSFF